MGLRFGVTLARVEGTVVGLTLGWDRPTPLWKPYLTVEMLGWMVCVGWSRLLDEVTLRAAFDQREEEPYERQAYSRAMRRDYWGMFNGGGPDSMERVAAGRVHDAEFDSEVPYFLPTLLEEAGILDGDEFEILVTATERRPHGDRLFVRDLTGRLRPESDEECEERIEGHGCDKDCSGAGVQGGAARGAEEDAGPSG